MVLRILESPSFPSAPDEMYRSRSPADNVRAVRDRRIQVKTSVLNGLRHMLETCADLGVLADALDRVAPTANG